jgi:hypothetical protein
MIREWKSKGKGKTSQGKKSEKLSNGQLNFIFGHDDEADNRKRLIEEQAKSLLKKIE